MASSGPFTIVAEETVLIFLGNWILSDSVCIDLILSILSFIAPAPLPKTPASSVLSQRRTGCLSGLGLSATTIPSDSDLLLIFETAVKAEPEANEGKLFIPPGIDSNIVGKESVSSESDAEDTIGVIARVLFLSAWCDATLFEVDSGLLLIC